MNGKSVFKKSRRVLALSLVTAAAGSSAAADSNSPNFCWSNVRANSNPELLNLIANEFKIVHGIQLDWRKALEVSDDEEGSNCIFSADNGRTITLPIEAAAATAPNKFTDN